MFDVRQIARHYGGDVSGGQALIPAIGHSSKDRGVAVKAAAGAPDGCLVHCFNGGDPLAEKDRLRADGFLPERKQKADIGPWKAVTTFEYSSADGEVIYRTVRREPENWTGPGKRPKEFRAERYEDRRWQSGIEGCARVPYRLPELLKAIAEGEPVYLVEGEAKADKLAAMGFVATAIAFGAKGWRVEYAQHFEGATVHVLPDNDEPGRDFARRVYADLSPVAKPSIIELPGLPDAGDIVDWNGSPDDLAALTAEAVKPVWLDNDGSPATVAAEPVDLWQHYHAPALPEGLMPEAIEGFARTQSEIMGVDPAGLAMATLCVCAAAISDDIQLQVKRHDPSWRESARLWVGLVGSPSMKKTPIISTALRPLRRIDGNLMRVFVQKKDDYDRLTAKEKREAERPRQERRVISDATVEAAQEVLRDSPRGVLSAQDELSGWFGQMDKYAPGKGSQADRAFWLQAYNGGTYSLNRVGRGASYIPNCSVSLLGGIQPEPVRAIAGDTHDDGLVQRLIPVVLRPGKVGRDIPADKTLSDYERLIERLEVMRPSAHLAGDGRVSPLRLSDAARAIRERLELEHLELVAALEGVSPKLAAHFGKYDGLFARLCVIWHCVDHADQLNPPGEVSERTAERVAAFMERYLRPSAIAFYAGLLGLSAGHEQVLDLAAEIISQRHEEVNSRTVQRSTRSLRGFSADEARRLCEKLEAFGWLEPADPKSRSNTPRWTVNPAVHDLFGDRAEKERERRAKAHKALKETLNVS